MSGRQPVMSAQVILKPASGAAPREPVTSSNLRDVLPSAEAARRAPQAFAEAGFEVGPVVANSFSITGPATTFEKVFGTTFRRDKQSGDTRPARHGAGEYELPLSKLVGEVSQMIQAVTLTPPPDFGPTDY
jgi:hypothetical protein